MFSFSFLISWICVFGFRFVSLLSACRSEEKAVKAIENITFELEAAAKAIRHNKDTGIKGKVRGAPL